MNLRHYILRARAPSKSLFPKWNACHRIQFLFSRAPHLTMNIQDSFKTAGASSLTLYRIGRVKK